MRKNGPDLLAAYLNAAGCTACVCHFLAMRENAAQLFTADLDPTHVYLSFVERLVSLASHYRQTRDAEVVSQPSLVQTVARQL